MTHASHPSYSSAKRGMVLGVTGHRPGRLRCADVRLLQETIRQVLKKIVQASGAEATILSPLAEGADRLVAKMALAAGLELHCVLPFPKGVYIDDFETASSRADYLDLLSRASSVVELENPATTQVERDAGYTAAGHYTVDHAHILIAIWDGGTAAGQGGTGEIVAYALARRIPVVWIASHRPHGVRLLVADVEGILEHNLSHLPRALFG